MEDLKLEIKEIIPNPPSREVNEQIALLGIEIFNLLQVFDYIRREIEAGANKRPHTAYWLIKGFIDILSTPNINQVHIEIARTALSTIEKEESKQDKNASLENHSAVVEILARKLNEACHDLKSHLMLPKELKQPFDELNKIANQVALDHSILKIIDIDDPSEEFESLFKENSMFIWDNQFLKYLRTTGEVGTASADAITPMLIKNYKDRKNLGGNPLELWFNLAPCIEKPFYLSGALVILTRALWKDIVSCKTTLIKSSLPSITHIVQGPITKMLHRKNVRQTAQNEIRLWHKADFLGRIYLPAVRIDFVDKVFQGINNFGSLLSIRLVRYFAKKPYENLKNLTIDYRILRYDGGLKEIARELGISTSGREISNLESLILALDHFKFECPEVTSRLINAALYTSPITHRKNEGLEITVLSPLLPYRTFEDGGLLVPLLKEPKLIGDNKTHAGQLLLQWKVAEEFTRQSRKFTDHGFIILPKPWWEEQRDFCSLTKETFAKVVDHWKGPEQFLVMLEDDRYTLGNNYQEAFNHYQDQGIRRNKNSQRGKKSYQKRIREIA